MELSIQSSCEIGDLIQVVAERLSKTYDEVESKAFDERAYPEGRKSCIGSSTMTSEDEWFTIEVKKIAVELNISSLYITEAI